MTFRLFARICLKTLFNTLWPTDNVKVVQASHAAAASLNSVGPKAGDEGDERFGADASIEVHTPLKKLP